MKFDTTTTALWILRLSLAFVFLWFGFSQLADIAAWVSFVPAWVGAIIPVGAVVMINAVVEIVAGLFLAFNGYVRIVAIILGIHLFLIAVSV